MKGADELKKEDTIAESEEERERIVRRLGRKRRAFS